jgi:hypothetical protein
MSQTNEGLDFSEKAKRIDPIASLAFKSSNYELEEEPMNTNQYQNYSITIPHPLAEILLNILARASAAHSNN